MQRHKVARRRFFSDGVWGGKRKALAAALAWRDQQIDPLAAYAHELWLRNLKRRNNSSGLPGVGRYRGNVRADGARSPDFWLASWIDGHGVSRKRKFSVKRWGERGAKQKAIEVRDREVREAVAVRTERS